MPNSHLRLLGRITGTPLFIQEAKLRVITEAVAIPLMLGQRDTIDPSPSMSMATAKTEVNAPARVAVINVFDSLVSKNASAASGMTSYEGISAKIKRAVSEGATDIGFYIDSPGGEVSGLFGLTQEIRDLKARGISTFAFTDGMATSAAYAIFAACEKGYATPTAIVGSIAAIMTHMETSIGDAQTGRTYTIFRSKEEKALGDSHTPLSAEAKTKIENILASMDASFNNDVALSRPNLTVKAIINMKGSEFMAETGLELGLLDKVVTNMDAALNTHFSKPLASRGTRMTLEELQTKLAAAEATIAEMKTSHEVALSAAIQTATTAERTRCLAVMDAAPTLRLDAGIARDHIEKGYTTDASLGMMTAIATAITDKTPIDTSTSTHATLNNAGGGETDKTTFLKDAVKAVTGRSFG